MCRYSFRGHLSTQFNLREIKNEIRKITYHGMCVKAENCVFAYIVCVCVCTGYFHSPVGTAIKVIR